MAVITLADVKENAKIKQLIESANHVLKMYGYTEHGLRHGGYVSSCSAAILRDLGYSERTVELAAIAGWVHDVGNTCNRLNHSMTGAVLIYPLLMEMGMPMEEIVQILSAVGNHEEQNGIPVSEISSALIIADKSDAHRTRVRKGRYNPDDIHDRVNYAIKENWVKAYADTRVIRYEMVMDNTASIMDFMTIYLSRMQMCEQAAQFLGCRLDIVINGVVVNSHRFDPLPQEDPLEEQG